MAYNKPLQRIPIHPTSHSKVHLKFIFILAIFAVLEILENKKSQRSSRAWKVCKTHVSGLWLCSNLKEYSFRYVTIV